MSEIRTRFAPSPTGWMHIGNLRTALYAYLYAKSQNGTFILRIEDTDVKREVEGAREFIMKTLKTAGLNWDEGPDVGGDFGPYVQSERKDIYKKYAEKLVELGGGYYCFCEADKEFEKGELNPCRNLTPDEVKEKVDAGEDYVIRQKIPQEGETIYFDLIYGEIKYPNKELDEGVMLKSDGLPTYNFANVVDDHLMGITHVMRGNEYLSSTPKYELLYKAFGWKSPKYVHLTQIMKDATQKLSKRHGSASFSDLTDKGYLPDAIINYVALLGWSSGDDREFFTLEDLVKNFKLKGLQKSPAIFDQDKLNWLNGQHMMKLSDEDFHQKAMAFYSDEVKEKCDVEYLSTVLKTRIDYLAQIPEMTAFLVKIPDHSTDLFTNEKMKSTLEITKESVEKIVPKLEVLDEWSEQNVKDVMFRVVEELGYKVGQVLWPLRIALSGEEFTPGGAVEIAVVIGKEETLARFKIALEKLG